MPTPAEINDFMIRFNEQVGNLSQTNTKLMFFREFWDNFTAGQKTGIKSTVSGDMDAAIAALEILKTEVNGF